MVLTRSNQGKKEENTYSDGQAAHAAGTEDIATTSTTYQRTNSTSDNSTTEESSTSTARRAAATATSDKTVTVVARNDASTERAALKPARSRHSKASSKRLLAELEAKERLAELELKRIRAEAELEKIRREKLAAETSDSELEDDELLAPRRVNDWFERRQKEEATTERELASEEKRELVAHDIKERPGPQEAQPRPLPTIDVASLATAFAEAIQASRSSKKFIAELPIFSGHSQEWLQFKAAYQETAPSFSNSENVSRIRRSLRGAAWDTVSALLIGQPHPEDLIQSLQRRYGRPDALLIGEMEKIRALPKLTDNPRDLCMFASRISNTVATIEILKKPHYLYNPEVLRQIVEKFTPILRNKWYDYAAIKEDTPELKRIAEFLNREADKCAPYAPLEHTSEHREMKMPRKKIERTYVTAAPENAKNSTREKSPCPLCEENHQLPSCPQFAKNNTSERWEIAKKNRICYRCLSSKHRRIICRAKACGQNGCAMKHHRLLHHEAQPKIAEVPAEEQPLNSEKIMATSIEQVTAAKILTCRAYLKIAPVVLTGPSATMETFALLDEGSTVTIIDSATAHTLGLDGPTEPMWVQGVSGSEISHEQSKKVGVKIRGKHQENTINISDARTIPNLSFATQSVRESEIEDCDHLQEIKHQLLYVNATPKILIGQDNWELIVSREIRKGRRDKPVASRTALGWVLHGCRTSHSNPIAHCYTQVQRGEANTEDLEKIMKKFFAIESLSIEPRKPRSDPEQQALNILEERSRRLPDGRYETGLLWRDANIKIPNNKTEALKRLYSLEKKLDRDEELKKQYNERIENLLKSNYAEPVRSACNAARTWYLPHFAVVNPDKPKIRVVHDAAATYHGQSLNDMLLPGPDLLQSLPGVIMRFRQYKIAVSADIKEMFMQIKIRSEDRDALRFLWRGNRREGPPAEYRMTSLIFGASSSPCTALYIKNRNAREHAHEFPAAARAIEKNHYMDDYLQSFATIEEAHKTTKEVDHVHKQANFQLRGWATNTHAALKEVTHECERDSAIAIPIGGSETEKTLGLLWNTKQDCINFRINTRRAPPEILENSRPPTKREALSIIMSIFDPLGLISPITTPAKRIMQDTWRYHTEWDEEIPVELQDRWEKWLQQLKDLGNLKIPRCYETQPATCYELHTFVDASEEAYAAASYWRIQRADGTITVALAAAKSRVTPTKPISIPRLELQAAVLGVRLAKSVAEEHDFTITRKIYWSDSRTALAWIRAEPRAFKTFVAHRLAEIEDNTKKNQWRWLPSQHNVADDATRSTPRNFNEQHRWFTGPLFLYEPEGAWPVEHATEQKATGEEKIECYATQHEEHAHGHLPKIERFSKWIRLLRATARVLQFIDLCRPPHARFVVAAMKRKRSQSNPTADAAWNKPSHSRLTRRPSAAYIPANKYIILEAQYLKIAELKLIRASQEDTYRRERKRITTGRAPDKDDKLARLSVYLDEDCIVRLKGRIGAADDIQDVAVNPAILHGKHYYTRLYIKHVHEQLHHGGTEIVVNDLRQRVFIVNIRPTVKSVIAECSMCRLRKAKPASPITGNLPAARLAHHVRPFSYTGLDYYGPLTITVGRGRQKRYVALFTCMTSRAVHLEVVASLSTDSAINALRRFIARRGCPSELWSDNATAFHGAHRELTEAVKSEAAARRINWRFLPPAAPFMAGAWERMVRTVKEAMKTTLHEKYPSEETLLTLLAEVEATVNSRPLSYVPVNPEDPPALTPNMILIGPDSHSPPPGAFDERDVNARQHWRRAQQLADVFWRRWVREYMPLLQHRREPFSIGVSPAEGDVVIICDANLPRNTWPRGRVTKTYPGEDGVVRVVDVTTSQGHVLRRPTKKIVVLPVRSQSDGGRNVHDSDLV